ncbi:MAG TPA: MarR family winged helix-turn-helix transcriptional regulator [Chryseolinea sp.]
MNSKAIEEFRSFNRFYTSVIGLLDKHILNSSYTLAEVRILYELYHGKDVTASDLVERLSIDKGYLSRVLLQFAKRKFLTRERSQADTRVVLINLTQAGKKEFEVLNKSSNDQIKEILRKLSGKDLDLLLASMSQIKTILKQKNNYEKPDQRR